MIRIANYINDSIVDGPGIRFTIFFQGCKHACKGCFNKETWDFNKGTLIDENELMKIIKSNFLLSGVTFSGGDPFYQIEGALKMARLVKESGYHLISYTGFLFEELVEMSKSNPSLKELLDLIDVIIDGPFIEEEKSLELRFKGSKNQRVINVKKSLQDGNIVLEDYN